MPPRQATQDEPHAPVEPDEERAPRQTVQSHCAEVLLDHDGNVVKMRVCRNQDGRAIVRDLLFGDKRPSLAAATAKATEIAARDRHDCFLGMIEQRIELDVPVEPGEEHAPERAGWLSGAGNAVHPVGVPVTEL
jgi:hypothetical protein